MLLKIRLDNKDYYILSKLDIRQRINNYMLIKTLLSNIFTYATQVYVDHSKKSYPRQDINYFLCHLRYFIDNIVYAA